MILFVEKSVRGKGGSSKPSRPGFSAPPGTTVRKLPPTPEGIVLTLCVSEGRTWEEQRIRKLGMGDPKTAATLPRSMITAGLCVSGFGAFYDRVETDGGKGPESHTAPYPRMHDSGRTFFREYGAHCIAYNTAVSKGTHCKQKKP